MRTNREMCKNLYDRCAVFQITDKVMEFLVETGQFQSTWESPWKTADTFDALLAEAEIPEEERCFSKPADFRTKYDTDSVFHKVVDKVIAQTPLDFVDYAATIWTIRQDTQRPAIVIYETDGLADCITLDEAKTLSTEPLERYQKMKALCKVWENGLEEYGISAIYDDNLGDNLRAVAEAFDIDLMVKAALAGVPEADIMI